jgi:hypothetical protein
VERRNGPYSLTLHEFRRIRGCISNNLRKGTMLWVSINIGRGDSSVSNSEVISICNFVLNNTQNKVQSTYLEEDSVWVLITKFIEFGGNDCVQSNERLVWIKVVAMVVVMVATLNLHPLNLESNGTS